MLKWQKYFEILFKKNKLLNYEGNWFKGKKVSSNHCLKPVVILKIQTLVKDSVSNDSAL